VEKAFCEEERMNGVICDDRDGDKRKQHLFDDVIILTMK
jgi:hypothetical protein